MQNKTNKQPSFKDTQYSPMVFNFNFVMLLLVHKYIGPNFWGYSKCENMKSEVPFQIVGNYGDF
jgi:hypothetical protein